MTEGNIIRGSVTAAPRSWDADIFLEIEIKEVVSKEGSFRVDLELRYIDAETSELYKREQYELARGSILKIENLRSIAKRK